MRLTVGDKVVDHEAERELYREVCDPHYRRQKDELAATDYHAGLKRARALGERGALDALDRIDARCTPDPRPTVGGLEEVAEERREESAG